MEADTGSIWDTKLAVSSENVATVVYRIVDKTAINRKHNIGTSMLPWGTPDYVECRLFYSPSAFIKKCLSDKYNLCNWNSRVSAEFLQFDLQSLSKTWEILASERYLSAFVFFIWLPFLRTCYYSMLFLKFKLIFQYYFPFTY